MPSGLFVALFVFLVKLRTSRTRPKGLPWKLIISRHIVNRSTQMQITENQLHKIKQIYLPVLSKRNIQCSDRTFRSHDQNDKVYRNKLSTQPSSRRFRETWNCFGHSMVFNFSRKISLRNENLFGYISMGFTSFPLKICMRVPVDINFELFKNCGNQRKSL